MSNERIWLPPLTADERGALDDRRPIPGEDNITMLRYAMGNLRDAYGIEIRLADHGSVFVVKLLGQATGRVLTFDEADMYLHGIAEGLQYAHEKSDDDE